MSKVKESTKPVDAGIVGSFKFYKMGTDTGKEAAEYGYDVWNQLTSSIEGDSKANYSYNGEGLRVEKTVNDKVQRYLYEADQVVLEVDGSNNQIAKNTYGTNLLSREAGGQELYYMYNGHGDVTALIDAEGNTAATYYYDAFGNHTETTGEADNPYRYAGYQYDEETDLYYLNARYYDSKIARFMTEDTYRGEANDPLSLNLYTYCNNEPMMYSDPSGHSILPILIGIGIAVDAIVHIISGSSSSSGSGSSSKHDKDDNDDRNHQQQNNNDNVGSNNSHKATNNMNSNVPNAKAPVPVASKPAAASNCIQIGDTGSNVKKVQELLIGAGVWKVNVNGKTSYLTTDGDFGKTTLAAVKEFQSKHGLAADGVVGPATINALCKANLLGVTDIMLKGGYGRARSIHNPKQQLADFVDQETSKTQVYTPEDVYNSLKSGGMDEAYAWRAAAGYSGVKSFQENFQPMVGGDAYDAVSVATGYNVYENKKMSGSEWVTFAVVAALPGSASLEIKALKASERPVIKQGTKEWEAAVQTLRDGGKSNFRVESATDAKTLLKEGRGNMDVRKRYTTDKYDKGYEMHPNESHTANAPHNDLFHIKWKDWLSEDAPGVGHIFFNIPN